MPHPDTPHADLIAQLRAFHALESEVVVHQDAEELMTAAAVALSRALAEPTRDEGLEVYRLFDAQMDDDDGAAMQTALRAFLRNRGAG